MDGENNGKPMDDLGGFTTPIFGNTHIQNLYPIFQFPHPDPNSVPFQTCQFSSRTLTCLLVTLPETNSKFDSDKIQWLENDQKSFWSILGVFFREKLWV